ncbi:hypothetical protein K474DRAFT_1606413, partial [Panus rudis PR-1116 ss-1]
LLHIPDNILTCGPMWTTWTWFMERYCGILKHALKSRKHPWRNLDEYITQKAYLTQLRFKYTLDDELGYVQDNNELKRGERIIHECKFNIDLPEHYFL